MKNISISLLVAVGLLGGCQNRPAPYDGPLYEPTVESLSNYQPPEWYLDAKFGIWPHWGIYSVPAYRGDHAAEWYGRWMYCVEKEPDKLVPPRNLWNDYFDKRALKTAAYHARTYGDPREFGYHRFADMFKAEKWDPDQWARMAVDAGARFFCMMGMHHDSFALYDSDLTEWDAVDKGPHRDLVADMARAARRHGLKFGVSNHMAWNYEFFGFYHRNGFAVGQEELADFYSRGVVDDAYLRRWWERTTELVDKCRPDLYYFDWGWHGQPWRQGGYHEKFAAFFYNRALTWGRGQLGSPGVVLNSKYGPMARYCVRDIERGRMSSLNSRVWQTDTSISVHSWGYATDDEYYSPDYLVDSLVDIVSKNGILMLNFGPRADGTVPQEYYQPLMAMGRWLKINGEAIYATRPYITFGEGPALAFKPDHHGDTPEYTGADIRFTRSKDGKILYAIALEWPGETLTVTSLARGKFNADLIESVRLLGTRRDLQFTQTDDGLVITLPPRPDYGLAWPVRIQCRQSVMPPS